MNLIPLANMTPPPVRPRWTAGRRKAAARHARLGTLEAANVARDATADPVARADARTTIADFRVALDEVTR